MNLRIFFWSLTAALAGFLFGFDTVVISGAEKTIQSLWGLSPGLHGIAMASALCGPVVASLLGGLACGPVRTKRDSVMDRCALFCRGDLDQEWRLKVSIFIAARLARWAISLRSA
jgi:hypothetical protein